MPFVSHGKGLVCTDDTDPDISWWTRSQTYGGDTLSRNLYQKLAPNRTQLYSLYSVQVSSTRNFQTQPANQTAQFWSLNASVKVSGVQVYVIHWSRELMNFSPSRTVVTLEFGWVHKLYTRWIGSCVPAVPKLVSCNQNRFDSLPVPFTVRRTQYDRLSQQQLSFLFQFISEPHKVCIPLQCILFCFTELATRCRHCFGFTFHTRTR